MMNRLLFWLTGYLPARLIKVRNLPYLERYYLGTVFGITFYLHRFVRDDAERYVHNHPWTHGGSFVCCGSYLEERAVDICPFTESGCIMEYKRVRWINRVDGNVFHRITSVTPGTWTLFWHGPRQVIKSYKYLWGGAEQTSETLKGWGYLELKHDKLNSTTATVVFTPAVPDTGLKWWETAADGNHIEREPLTL